MELEEPLVCWAGQGQECPPVRYPRSRRPPPLQPERLTSGGAKRARLKPSRHQLVRCVHVRAQISSHTTSAYLSLTITRTCSTVKRLRWSIYSSIVVQICTTSPTTSRRADTLDVTNSLTRRHRQDRRRPYLQFYHEYHSQSPHPKGALLPQVPPRAL